MTDRELLEAAARAAGIFMSPDQWPYSDEPNQTYFITTYDTESNAITGTVLWYGEDGEIGGTEHLEWAPLTDDADAFRLAVALRILIEPCRTMGGKFVEVHAYPSGRGDCAGVESLEGDPYAATRRAIVRAAAALDKTGG